jgi:hypothetical protein
VPISYFMAKQKITISREIPGYFNSQEMESETAY